MIVDPESGDLLVVGGMDPDAALAREQDTIYRLSDIHSTWTLDETTLKTPRYGHVSMFVTDTSLPTSHQSGKIVKTEL